MDLDLEQLSHDTDIIAKIKQFRNITMRIEDTMKLATNPEVYEKLSNTDKIQYNLLMSYSLNSMFWMYLRTEGIDPTKHRIKMENERLKKCMTRARQINDRNIPIRRVNKDAAQRFIRNGLWEMKNKT
ncbi:Nuclear nucleic acid-binding protein C1D [Anthophora retusa]